MLLFFNNTNQGDAILKTVDNACYFCKKPGHQKRNCMGYKMWLTKQGRNGRDDSDGKKSDKVNSVEESNFLFAIGGNKKRGWIIDSGATKHVAHNKDFFAELNESYKSSVELANGETANVHGIGTGILTFVNERGNIHKAKVTDVLYAPKLVGNVLSVRRLAKNNFKVEFDDRICQIKQAGRQVGVADTVGGLYVLRQPESVCAVMTHNDNCIHQLHRRLGHRDPIAIRKMATDGLIGGLKKVLIAA